MELARKIGTSQSNIARMERGEQNLQQKHCKGLPLPLKRIKNRICQLSFYKRLLCE